MNQITAVIEPVFRVIRIPLACLRERVRILTCFERLRITVAGPVNEHERKISRSW